MGTFGRVVIASCVLGAVGLIGGMVIPVLIDPKTVQGPLLGIFMTGPLGVFIGGNLGVLWSARARGQTTGTEMVWLVVIAGVDLLLYEFFAVLGASFVTIVPACAFLVTGITAGLLLLYRVDAEGLRRVLLAISCAAPLLLSTALFPPVTANPLFHGPKPHLAAGRYRFVLNADLDTRRRVPPLTIDVRMLHFEWTAVLVLSAAVAALVPAPSAAAHPEAQT